MNTRLLIILLFVLLFAIAFPLKAVMPAALAESEVHKDTIWLVTGGTASADGAYLLKGTNWLASGISSGGAYQLSGPQSPSNSSEGCCCTYLPCVFKDW